MKRTLGAVCFVAAISLAPAANNAQADPLIILPFDASFQGFTDPPSNGGMFDDANAACGNCLTDEVFNSDGDSGILGGSYTYSQIDEHNGTLSYDGGSTFTGGFLFVKDGQANPNWFVFNLTALGWDGVTDLVLQDLFIADGIPEGDQDGGISHITLYGGSGPTSVPEPATLSMLGLGLFGLSIARRRAKLKTI